MKHLFLFFVSLALLSGCNKQPPIEANNLDSTSFTDSSLITPGKYLVSASNSTPDISKPVIVAAHGYTATPFEWSEFADFLKQQDSTVYISRVLLGGHGRDYDSFNQTVWKDWQKPIIEEYARLYNIGFRNISLAGSSTGCPLILDLISTSAFDSLVAPQNVFFIDPIIVPSNKMLNYVKVLSAFIPYVEVDVTPYEARYWYKYRGKKSLIQLNDLIKHCRKELKKGITLPEETRTFLVYKVKEDGSADPESAEKLYDGIRFADGSTIDTVMLNSDLHVFTRLKGRDSFTEKDRQFQKEAFNTMYNDLSQYK